MKFISTKDKQEVVSFEEAVVKGLARNKGLFMPESIPQLPKQFIENIEDYSNEAIAYEVLSPYTKGSIDSDALKRIIKETLSFPTPIVKVKDNIYVLELFHGPTKAFKDVGARFMSRCLGHFTKDRKVRVLVATSGDTGSAVANGFFDVDGVEVVILFPKGKVSPYQEYQMTSLGKNIRAIEIEGVFDDCQALVKQAFSDVELNEKMNLSSANSINVARLLPQMLYYIFAYKDLPKEERQDVVFSVPSGNLGNLTAGVIAKQMGFPFSFIGATNANDTFDIYLKTGEYEPKASIATFSNAMDVGAPSNFERLEYIYDADWQKMKSDIQSATMNNEQTLEQMKNVYQECNYILDPHGAVGMKCLEDKLKNGQTGIFLETAHPKKFERVVQQVVPDFPDNIVDLSQCKKTTMKNTYADFKAFLEL